MMKIKTKYNIGDYVIYKISEDDYKVAKIVACYAKVETRILYFSIGYKVERIARGEKFESEISETKIIGKASKKLISKYLVKE